MMMAALTAAALLACVGSAAADDFCTDYSLSPCADTPYHANHTAMFGQPCPAHLATLSVYQQTCVKYYLQFASSAESSHCDKARGEGPCAPADNAQTSEPCWYDASGDYVKTCKSDEDADVGRCDCRVDGVEVSCTNAELTKSTCPDDVAGTYQTSLVFPA